MKFLKLFLLSVPGTAAKPGLPVQCQMDTSDKWGNIKGKHLLETMPFKHGTTEMLLIHSEITSTHHLAVNAEWPQLCRNTLISD